MALLIRGALRLRPMLRPSFLATQNFATQPEKKKPFSNFHEFEFQPFVPGPRKRRNFLKRVKARRLATEKQARMKKKEQMAAKKRKREKLQAKWARTREWTKQQQLKA